jgi:secreted Zn-dependent insulinase-like peptidase
LETVYEEFNRNQDDDIRWSNFAIDSMLMPNHPYGTQTTIGLGEHLKNPSMINIHNYFDKYYVPNNMAVILCGDVDEKNRFTNPRKHTWQTHTKSCCSFRKTTSCYHQQSTGKRNPRTNKRTCLYRLPLRWRWHQRKHDSQSA